MWYISAALKPLGPFELLEIREKIRTGHISPHDLIFQEGSAQWKPAQDWDEVRQLGFPAFEAVGTDSLIEPVWIVLRRPKDPADQGQNYQQEGPMAGVQIVKFLAEGRLQGDDLVWKKGLSGWSRVVDRQEFTSPDL